MTPLSVLPYFHVAFMVENKAKKLDLFRAVLTDIQFWIPVAILVFGLLLLISLH